ncbi:MAG TPA: hypothetical protein VG758_09075 [Hyphomicrobiaceae bacterium]|jgi:hypothetical protein|nr:hypothetical protein [Hyphomicrobiaceae bacterium]
MRIERIVVTGDVFRTTDGDPNQLGNARWLRGELSRPIYELTGLWPDVRYRRNAPDDGRAIIGDWYRLLGHTPSLEAWAATFAQTAPPAALSAALSTDYDRALVIGFELSPLMRSVLDDIGAPWVDVGLSPIRFLDDLALDLRFSWPVEAAHPGLVLSLHVEEAVQGVRTRHRHDASAADLSGACIFLAQTRQDRTLIKDGAFFRDEETVARVAQALQGRPLVLKPHPLAPDNPLLATLLHRFAAPVTDANVYAILAAARDARLLTISSSAAIEARHFGHAPEIFHAAAHADAAPLSSLWAHRSTAFWRTTLAPILPLKADADFEELPIPNRLRRTIGGWGWSSSAPAPLQGSTPTAVRAVP